MAAAGAPGLPTPPIQPDPIEENIKRKLLKQGVYPTPKIVHTLRKKHIQKTLRKSKKQSLSFPEPEPHNQELADEAPFLALKIEYRNYNKVISKRKKNEAPVSMLGKPWERLERGEMRKRSNLSNGYGGEKLKTEHLRELGNILKFEFRWLLDDDIELEQRLLDEEKTQWAPPK